MKPPSLPGVIRQLDVTAFRLQARGKSASLLLVFLVPTTLIFHTAPVGPAFFMHLALIGGLILAITRPHAGGVPSFSGLRANKHFRHD